MKLDKLLIVPYESYSNYVNLPNNILEKLTNNKNIVTPYFFELKTSYETIYYVGVKEFTAMEGTIEVPQWIAENIGEDFINIKLFHGRKIKKGVFVKIEPQSKDFFSIPENDIILESALAEYCILQLNQIISVKLLDEVYQIKIIEMKTDNDEDVSIINIINCDLNVDMVNIFPEEIPIIPESIPIETSISEPTITEPPKIETDDVRAKRVLFYKNMFKKI
jgi:ubiquitin fusion degradation protein 1